MNSSSSPETQKSAEEFFASGFFCAESVVLAIAKQQNITSELLPKVATAFCSGISRSCDTCGALNGAIMGVSLSLGRSSVEESVEPAYLATRQLTEAFETEFGSSNCKTLLNGCDLNTADGQTMFKEKNLRQRCIHITGRAAEIAVQVIMANSKD